MKKLIACAIAGMMIFSTACAESTSPLQQTEAKPLNIVCTIFPQYDWVRQILGGRTDDVALTLLLDKGTDLHSYQPTADDMVKISESDVFVYVGGESDVWVADALREAENKNMAVINLLEVLGNEVKEEEVVEGMQLEEEEHAEGEPEYDEHVWLSLKNAQTICKQLVETLSKADPENAALYEKNATEYIEKLAKLDGEYQAAVDASAHKTLLFGDRFPFRYLADDYGLDYYAAFVGCSAETEASFATVSFLAGKLDELSLPGVLTIEGAQHKIADTVVSNTKTKSQDVLTLNSMQSVTEKDVQNGVSYLEIMQSNLEVLKKALG